MKVITEISLRNQFLKEPFTHFSQKDDQLLTPSALQFLRDKGVVLEAAVADGLELAEPEKNKGRELEYSPQEGTYSSAYDGGTFTAKPEHMTQIHGRILVVKDDPAILFRGKLDSFQAELLLVQADSAARADMVADLDDILRCSREVMRADVLGQELNFPKMLGLDSDQLRAHSHNPKKEYGVGHILPDCSMGESLLKLNLLRSRARELELAGVAAFRRDREYLRGDILEVLNRLSSALYIMMVRERAGHYDK